MPPRCAWVTEDPLYIDYHDREWGVPVHDERTLFEFLVLEGAQAGLSWLTVLKKRAHYRHVFEGFDPNVVAGFDDALIERLLADPGIIRNRLKVEAARRNARAFLEVQNEYDGFSRYLWGFTDGRPVLNHWRNHADVPAATPLSARLAKDLKRRGFRFVGSTICYAYLQAVGVVMDHTVNCFRYRELVQASTGPR